MLALVKVAAASLETDFLLPPPTFTRNQAPPISEVHSFSLMAAEAGSAICPLPAEWAASGQGSSDNCPEAGFALA